MVSAPMAESAVKVGRCKMKHWRMPAMLLVALGGAFAASCGKDDGSRADVAQEALRLAALVLFVGFALLAPLMLQQFGRLMEPRLLRLGGQPVQGTRGSGSC